MLRAQLDTDIQPLTKEQGPCPHGNYMLIEQQTINKYSHSAKR